MRIGINSHILAGESAGIRSYADGLLAGLVAIDRENEYLLFGRRAPLQPFLCGNVGVEEAWLPTERRAARILWEHFILPLRARMRAVELLHLPDHTHPLLDSPCPSIITVHDLAFVRYPQTFDRNRRLYKNLFIKRSTRKAARIIADSGHTRDELLTLLGVPARKISVIHGAPHKRYHTVQAKEGSQRVRQKHGLPERFILYVGTLEPRKNLKGLLRAYHLLLKQGKNHIPLVVAGGKGWLFHEIFQLVETLGLQGRVLFPGFIPGEDLPAIYNAAELFIYPSVYEGFGLPILEAMACGTPVVTSNTSSIPEVAGDAAILVNPASVEDLAEAMHRVLADAGLREELSKKGLERSRLFSWEEAARRTLKVYQEAFVEGKG